MNPCTNRHIHWRHSTNRSFSSSSSRKEIVKVPQMAESITEGTLKQWNKKVGDFVKADEEVATIETDKVSFICTLHARASSARHMCAASWLHL